MDTNMLMNRFVGGCNWRYGYAKMMRDSMLNIFKTYSESEDDLCYIHKQECPACKSISDAA